MRLFVVLLALLMLAIWALFYVMPPTTYPYSLEHIAFGFDTFMRLLGYQFR